MTNGTVVRSMVLNDGYVIALDDGLISWRPSGGRRTNHRLQYPASILLGMKGPTGKCESIIMVIQEVTSSAYPYLNLSCSMLLKPRVV